MAEQYNPYQPVQVDVLAERINSDISKLDRITKFEIDNLEVMLSSYPNCGIDNTLSFKNFNNVKGRLRAFLIGVLQDMQAPKEEGNADIEIPNVERRMKK